jgi:hypothetical protein
LQFAQPGALVRHPLTVFVECWWALRLGGILPSGADPGCPRLIELGEQLLGESALGVVWLLRLRLRLLRLAERFELALGRLEPLNAAALVSDAPRGRTAVTASLDAYRRGKDA